MSALHLSQQPEYAMSCLVPVSQYGLWTNGAARCIGLKPWWPEDVSVSAASYAAFRLVPYR